MFRGNNVKQVTRFTLTLALLLFVTLANAIPRVIKRT